MPPLPAGTGARGAVFPAAAVPLLFLGLFFVLFSPVILAGDLLAPGDGYRYYLPALKARSSLWSGALFGGFPRFADPEMMTFYPLAALLRVVPVSYNVFVVLGYALAGTLSSAFVTVLTGSRLAGIVG